MKNELYLTIPFSSHKVNFVRDPRKMVIEFKGHPMNFNQIIRTKNLPKLSHLVLGFVIILLLAEIIIPVSAAGIMANREISVGKVNAGEIFTVTVHIKADQHVEALTLHENLPDGWQLNQIDNDGAIFQNISTFKESTKEWIWVNNVSKGEEKTVKYDLSVPINFKPGISEISGTISAYSIPAVPVVGLFEIKVTSPLPYAEFSATPLSGFAPLSVRFTDLTTNNVSSWEWDFNGDGIVDSKEQNPSYTYEKPGSYTVILRAANSTFGNDTETKTGYITVIEVLSNIGESKLSGGSNSGSGGSEGNSSGSEGSSDGIEGSSGGSEGNSGGSGGSGENSGGSSGGSGGGGGGSTSPESINNIELKEISNEQIFKGVHTYYNFKNRANDIVSLEFDPKKSFGKTTAIIEVLKNTSSIVKEPAPGDVYKNINIWIGNSGFSNPENLENARITFRVSKTWIYEKGLGKNQVMLYRYNQNKWNPLSTVLKEEKGDYFYFTSDTPGFSPFAISYNEKKTDVPAEKVQTKNEKNLTQCNKNLSEEKQKDPNSDSKTERHTSLPDLRFLLTAADLLISYAIIRRRK